MGEAKDANQIQYNVVRVDGQRSAYLPIMKQGGDTNTIEVVNGIREMIGKLLDIFEIGPVPMSGSAATVKQTTRTLAPSMRMNADLGDWDASLLNVQIGQSGQPLSGHYKG